MVAITYPAGSTMAAITCQAGSVMAAITYFNAVADLGGGVPCVSFQSAVE